MQHRKAIAGLAAIAVGGVLVLGGCGGSDSTTSSEPAKATTPAMKDDGGAMKDDGGAMKDDGGAMKDDGGAMKDEGDDHGEAMKDG